MHCFKPQVCGDLLWQPQETSTLTNTDSFYNPYSELGVPCASPTHLSLGYFLHQDPILFLSSLISFA